MIQNDVLNKEILSKELAGLAGKISFEYFDETNSTNTYLKENADKFPDFHVAIAGSQSSGRGRMGRSFYSPVGTGVYISILLKDNIHATDTEKLTTAAAVAACRAIHGTCGISAKIKWINDIYIDGKKAAGILAEGRIDPVSKAYEYSVVGIGINVYEPEGGFPEDIKDVAGAVVRTGTPVKEGLRAKIAAGFIKEFHTILTDSVQNSCYIDEYKELNFIPGIKINVIRNGKTTPAVALGIDKNCHLIVRYETGSLEVLSSGEVSVRVI